MSKSLAELRASDKATLPERSHSLCLAQGLVAEAQALEEEKATLVVDAGPDEDGDHHDGPPRRAAEGPPPRIAEIDARLEELWDEMREHTGDLRLRGTTAGDWRRWVDKHPARPDNKVDEAVTYGYCDADALLGDLGRYAVSYEGTTLGEGDWEFIANRAAPGDLKALCSIVVQMHEGPGASAPPKSRSPLSATGQNGTASP